MELSIGEMLVVLLVIVVLFGPDKIPSIARELGQGVRKMKSAVEDIKTEIMKETDGSVVSDIKKEIDGIKDSVADINPIKDIQRQIEDVKSSVNPMEQTVYDESEKQKSDIETKSENSNEKTTEISDKGKNFDKLSNDYSGSVSR